MNDHRLASSSENARRGMDSRRPWQLVVLIAGIIAISVGGSVWHHYQPESCYRRAREALEEGNDDVVVRESERLILSPGHEPQGRLLKGILLARTGELVEAVAELEKAGSDSTSAEASSVAAKCFYRMGRYLEAIDAAHAALEKNSSETDARRWLASAYYDLGAVSHAVVELELLSKEDPSDARPDQLLGLIAKDAEEYAKAINHYEESLRRQPKQPDRERILNELAEAKIKLGQFEKALVTLRGCSKTAESLTREAECRHGLGDDEQAKVLLRDAIALNSRYFPAWLVQGKLFLDIIQPEKAIGSLEEAIRIEPWHSQPHYQLSQALLTLGRSEQAAEEMRRMEEIKGQERQFTDLHEAAMKEPTNADIRFRTGELAVKLGKPELVMVWFRAALAIEPHHEGARAAIIELERNARSTRLPPNN